MPQTVVIFDGRMFRLEASRDLAPTERNRVASDPVVPTTDQEDAWDVLDAFTGSMDEPEDWSSEHDHYLYGTPKRHTQR